MCTLRTAALAAGSLSVCLFISGASRASIIISEIMYNPDSSEAAPNDVEWVELYNTGPTSVSIGNWTLRDEDGTSSSSIPAGTSIDSGEAVVLSSAGSVGGFRDAWGTGFGVFLLSFGELKGLNNSPSATNEILQLIDASSAVVAVVDTVNFDDSGAWPSDSPDGSSIYLLSSALSGDAALANDDGANWSRSEVGLDGAYQNAVTAAFNRMDVGSPGFVQTSAVPEPSTLALMSLGLLCGAARFAWRRRFRV